MWSKTKKALDNRLADALKDRIRYGCEVYTTTKIKWWTETPVFYIHVDDELWFATNPMHYIDERTVHRELMDEYPDDMAYWDIFYATYPEAKIMGLKKYGRISMDALMKHVHGFLNEVSIDEALYGTDYMYLIFAIIDRRVGKRRVKQLVDKLQEYPEWIQKWIRLRAESENIRVDEKIKAS